MERDIAVTEELGAGAADSERLEGEVAVEGENGLAPEEDEGGLLQLLDAVVDEADGGPESTVEVSKEEDDLRFAGLEAVGVLVLLLVVGEEALAGCSGVGVLPGEDGLGAELDQVLLDVSAAVVGGVVQEEVGVLPPVGILLGEDLSEAR